MNNYCIIIMIFVMQTLVKVKVMNISKQTFSFFIYFCIHIVFELVKHLHLIFFCIIGYVGLNSFTSDQSNTK